MIDSLPNYISIIFILTTFLTVGFIFYAVRRTCPETVLAKILLFLLPFWLFFQAVLSLKGFYLKTDALPPRLFLFAVLPALLLVILLFIFYSESFVSKLSLKTLTLLSVIRIPVEIVLYWLFVAGQIPQLMTFEGRNFDILSGVIAPLVALLAFSNGKANRILLIVWNVFGLLLLLNIVVTAAFSLPSPMQQFAFEQPNRAVLYFPFVWLPAVVVPIVLFSHLASLRQLFSDKLE
ncbi:MAG: hypothetical protein H0U87_02010 [Acidobacteria bacterium]|jgi:hypothetical protein|nr:hypothetical protein [Acidobacteriota bacterium]